MSFIISPGVFTLSIDLSKYSLGKKTRSIKSLENRWKQKNNIYNINRLDRLKLFKEKYTKCYICNSVELKYILVSEDINHIYEGYCSKKCVTMRKFQTIK